MAGFHLKTKQEVLISFWISTSQQAANKLFQPVTQSPVSAALGVLQHGTPAGSWLKVSEYLNREKQLEEESAGLRLH